jgi:geranylgeranylglycerol-phosphate geranylgeranyltransferase
MSKIISFLNLIRPLNCLMMGVAVIVGAAFTYQNFDKTIFLNLFYGFITGFVLTAASMSINDYYDREIDIINEPNRPIPKGNIKPNEALIFASILTGLGFITAYYTNTTNILCLITAIISWIASVVYTTLGKKTGLFGNFLVSLCVVTSFIFGGLSLNSLSINSLIFVTIAFLSVTGREITKGIADVSGDKTKNIRTLAVTYGEKKAAKIAILFYLSAVILSALPWLLKIVSVWFFPFVIITDVGLVMCSISLLKDYSRENARKVKQRVLIFSLFALLAFLLGTIK